MPSLSKIVIPAVLLAWPIAGLGQDCSRLESFAYDGHSVRIENAGHVASGTGRGGAPEPAHCRIDGVIDERTGINDVAYGIRFALALPDDWNGRFLFQGGGGLNGSVGAPVGDVAAGGRSALERGFAVISTDTGHSGSVFDATFMADQQAALDFFYAAIGTLTPIAQAMVAEHYAREAAHSYYAGCSTGGREGMIMSQRYPSFFDGIVAGAPAMRTGHSNMSLAYINAAFSEFAPRDANGQPSPAALLSASDRLLVMDGLLAACDGQDGIEDGMIFNTTACGFAPAELACSGAKADSCLSPGQVSALEKAFRGPVDALGQQVYPSFPWDTGLNAAGGFIPGILQSGGSSPVQTQRTAAAFDVDREAAALIADAQGRLGDPLLTDLSTFREGGSKLLFFHGMSDAWFSANDTRRYYESLAAANGGGAAVRDFSRLFLVPGMGHCAGGTDTLDNFDLLTAIVDWVENGSAPDAVTSTGSALPGRERPLCAYPSYAHHVGGDPDKVTSFECRVAQ